MITSKILALIAEGQEHQSLHKLFAFSYYQVSIVEESTGIAHGTKIAAKAIKGMWWLANQLPLACLIFRLDNHPSRRPRWSYPSLDV